MSTKMFVSQCLASVLLILCGVFGAETDEMKRVYVTEGDYFTLHTGVAEIKEDVQILWMFGTKNPDTLIAEIFKRTAYIYDNNVSVMKDRLQMNNQTGSLSIRNITARHSGLYKAEIINTIIKYNRFNVTVYGAVSLPVIKSSSLVNVCQTSECQKYTAACSDPDRGFSCEVTCSAENGPEVSLSWFKDNERLNQITNPDLNVSLSLYLEIKERNNSAYYCISANPVSNRSTQLSFQRHCPHCSNFIHSCDVTKAVTRLVLSALVGVATVIILLYDFRSTRGGKSTPVSL